MNRPWLVLLVLAAVVAIVALLLLLGGGSEPPEEGGIDRPEREAAVDPELRGLPASEREAWLERKRRVEERRAAEATATEEPGPDAQRVLVEGVVLSAEAGEPLVGVLVWWEQAKEPCPRMSSPFDNDAFVGEDKPRSTGTVQAHTNAQGRFRLVVGASSPLVDAGEPPASIDVFAYTPGRILHCACALAVPAAIEIRLEKGLSLTGRVASERGPVVTGALVRVRPAPETPDLPGHSTPFVAPETDEEGRFDIGGLVGGAVMLDVDHDHYMPRTLGPHDPADGASIDVVLVPALRLTFRLSTDDGRVPENPTLVWRTVESPPRGDVLLLRSSSITTTVGMDGHTEGTWTSHAVRLPCDAPSVELQVKAEGYGTWISDPLRLPPEGGAETLEVKLGGNYGAGRIELTLEDDAGETVHYARAEVQLAVGRLDAGAGAAAFVLEPKEHLAIPDMPAGSYRLLMRSASFAPAIVDVTVSPGRTTETTVRVRPPAKLKVRFVGPDAMLVRFRLTQGGTVVHGVPEGSFSRGTDEATGEPILTAGADGLVLSGLATGAYSVDVLSEEVTAPSTLVHLTEGDTEEVEIHVQPR